MVYQEEISLRYRNARFVTDTGLRCKGCATIAAARSYIYVQTSFPPAFHARFLSESSWILSTFPREDVAKALRFARGISEMSFLKIRCDQSDQKSRLIAREESRLEHGRSLEIAVAGLRAR